MYGSLQGTFLTAKRLGTLSMLLGTSAGEFASATYLRAPSSVERLALVDSSGDGLLDVIATAKGGHSTQRLPAGGYKSLLLLDSNADSWLDIVTANSGANVLWGNTFCGVF